MVLTNEELKQIDYFKGAFVFWYERCVASNSKTKSGGTN